MKKLLLLLMFAVGSVFGQTLDNEELSFLTLINAYRAQNGVAALQVSATLQASSVWMSNDMGTHNNFSHTDSLGRSPSQRIAAFGYPATSGENIAGGYVDAQSVLDGFKTECDPDAFGTCTFSHRLNMLNPGFKAIGIGRVDVPGSQYGWYWTTDFGTVVDQVLTPPTGQQMPTVVFSASPGVVNAGQPSTLSWNVSGASFVTINTSGPGTVTVTPTQTTTYTLSATNAAGTTVAQSTVTIGSAPPPPPPTGACPAPSVGVFTGCYFNNLDLLGNPALVRTDNQLNFNWAGLPAGPGLFDFKFSARWQGIFAFTGGSYNFTIVASDGFRFFIDGVPVRSAWRDIPTASTFVVAQTLSQGNHLLTLEYYESTGNGRTSLTW